MRRGRKLTIAITMIIITIILLSLNNYFAFKVVTFNLSQNLINDPEVHVAEKATSNLTWYFEDWLFRRKIIIDNTANTQTLLNFQVPINLTYDLDMQPDFSDIRFTWYNATDGRETEIPYWIESKVDLQWAYIWVKVPEIPASNYTTIYIYYGNTTPVISESNGTAVFEFFDDFDDGVISSNWVQMSGTWVENGGYLYVTTDYGAAPGNNIVWTGRTFSAGNYILETEGIDTWEICLSINHQGTTTNTAFDAAGAAEQGDILGINEWNGSAWVGAERVTMTINSGDRVYVKVWQIGTTLYAYAKDYTANTEASNSRTVTYTSGYIGLRISTGFTNSSRYDWVRVRKYTDPEPTYSTGVEEQRDIDQDGMPDKWEINHGLNPTTNDANEDPDNDGLTNLEEYNHGTNPVSSDTDEDGMPDGWEVQYELNPVNASDAKEDPDSDGLTNIEEYKLGTDPKSSDTDGDGFSDGYAVAEGYDPLDPESKTTTDEGVGLSFNVFVFFFLLFIFVLFGFYLHGRGKMVVDSSTIEELEEEIRDYKT